MKNFPEKDEVTVGIVDKIVGTSVFVKLKEGKEGVINFSEVAPGRIRNIRDYVKPGQKIVVKILRIEPEKGHIDLSLRRVTIKERKEVLEQETKEKELLTLIKISIKNDSKAKEIFDKITSLFEINKFFDKVLEKGQEEKQILDFLKTFDMNSEEAKAFYLILKEKIKEKKVSIKQEFSLYNKSEDGLEKIKKVLSYIDDPKVSIKYLGAPHYLITIEEKDYKEANKKMKETLSIIEQKAKSENCFFEINTKK